MPDEPNAVVTGAGP